MTTPWSAETKAQKPKKPKEKKPAKEANPSTDPRRVWGKKSRQSPRHSNTVRRVLLIASMAWEGRSAGEIADNLGVSVQYVYQLCSDYRVRLIPKTRSQYAFRVVIELESLTRLEAIAAQRGDDVIDLVTRSIDALSNEPVLLANLIEEAEEPPPRRRSIKKAESVVDNDPEAED
jgi:hypothetical protein